MTIKSDKWIIKQCTRPLTAVSREYGKGSGDDVLYLLYVCRSLTDDEAASWKPMIEPFHDEPVRYVDGLTGLPVSDPDAFGVRKILSYGTSSYGYDVRLKADPDEIKVFTNIFEAEINPKKMKSTNFATPMIRIDDDGGKYVLIPANSYIQAPTMEYFSIPRDVLVVVVGKSTLARAGLICNVTPIEPEFEGEVVIEIANCTTSPVRCYLEEGVCQFLFYQSDEQCLRSYKDKAGKYQGQRGLTLAKV